MTKMYLLDLVGGVAADLGKSRVRSTRDTREAAVV